MRYDEVATIGLFQEDPSCRRYKEKYRLCLMKIGKSPDAHVYSLDLDFFLAHPGKAADYILKMRRFYDGLDEFKKRVFLSECLEVGRIYPFWYYGWMSEPVYRKERSAVIASFKEEFK